MNAPTYNLVHAVRRFVGLRSAWRRSLAMEPRQTVRRDDEPDQERRLPPKPGSGGAVRRPCCCHA